MGEIALTSNEFKTAERLKKDYWLYVVFNCESTRDLHIVNNPATMEWKPVMLVEHYFVKPAAIMDAAQSSTP